MILIVVTNEYDFNQVSKSLVDKSGFGIVLVKRYEDVFKAAGVLASSIYMFGSLTSMMLFEYLHNRLRGPKWEMHMFKEVPNEKDLQQMWARERRNRLS